MEESAYGGGRCAVEASADLFGHSGFRIEVPRGAGYQAAVCFIVQMEGMRYLEPNDATHPQFGDALRRVAKAGVEVLAMECAVTPEELRVIRPLPVRL